MDLETGAGLLHRLTSYTMDREWDVRPDDPRLRHDLGQNVPALRPPQVKVYPDGLPVVELPRVLPEPGVSATAALAGSTAPPRALDAAELARVIFLWAGVVRTSDIQGTPFLFR